ncbi:unnamed protein product [Protopolystoma xenopodis]|uniref:Uncharacterized protein n=1 Tax=Protopolystoma xenopodis TaxID=117903 RepID=A0A3S5FGR5_9PLAT|nr:unnamed protein product [Protopolystoma xenopodis]
MLMLIRPACLAAQSQDRWRTTFEHDVASCGVFVTGFAVQLKPSGLLAQRTQIRGQPVASSSHTKTGDSEPWPVTIGALEETFRHPVGTSSMMFFCPFALVSV